MPQQLIYTSAPRGLVAGRSGHCTVARSASMREALMLLLEKLSYYQHLSLSGGRDRPIFASRIGDIRGSRYHILSRIQDAGLDFTGRTNFIAHHLVFTPDEIRRNALPPVILNDWRGWAKSWTAEPELLENEDWSGLTILASGTNVPAKTWRLVTGDAVNGYGLLEARNGASFRVDDQSDEIVLKLVAESLELLEVREPRKDFRAAAWEYTFTSSMQEQDNPADFRWRFIHSDNPSASRFVAPDCRPLTAARAAKWTAEETAFARVGRQPPRFVVQPQPNTRSDEGEPVRLKARAEGVPSPSYQWFVVDRTDNGQVIPHANESELLVQNPPLGVSRYVVRASNSQGQVTSEVAKVSVESKLTLSKAHAEFDSSGHVKSVRPSYVKTETEIERNRREIAAQQAEVQFHKKLRRKKLAALFCGLILGLVVLSVVLWPGIVRGRFGIGSGRSETNNPTTTAPPITNTVTDAPTILASGNVTNRQNAASNTAITIDNKAASSDSSQAPRTGSQHSVEYPLPSGWTELPIGSVAYHRSEFLTPANKFSLTAEAVGFTTNGDHFLFVCQTNIVNEFQAMIFKIDPKGASNKVGIMIRESQKANSPFLFIGSSGQKIIASRRDGKGNLFNTEPAAPPKDSPLLVKLHHTNDQFVASYYWTGKWFSVKDYVITKSNNMLLGFVVSSGSVSDKATAHFTTGAYKSGSQTK